MTNSWHFSEWRNCIRAQRKVNLCAPGAPKGPKVGMCVRQYEIVCANDAGRAPRKYPVEVEPGWRKVADLEPPVINPFTEASGPTDPLPPDAPANRHLLEMRAEALTVFREHKQRVGERDLPRCRNRTGSSTRPRFPPTLTSGCPHRANAAGAKTNAGANDAVDYSTESDKSASASIGRKSIWVVVQDTPSLPPSESPPAPKRTLPGNRGTYTLYVEKIWNEKGWQ